MLCSSTSWKWKHVKTMRKHCISNEKKLERVKKTSDDKKRASTNAIPFDDSVAARETLRSVKRQRLENNLLIANVHLLNRKDTNINSLMPHRKCVYRNIKPSKNVKNWPSDIVCTITFLIFLVIKMSTVSRRLRYIPRRLSIHNSLSTVWSDVLRHFRMP